MSDKIKEEELVNKIQTENEELFQKFIEGEGKLPTGFSPFSESKEHLSTGNPFKEYLNSIRHSNVDALHNGSGLRVWYRLDESMDINIAAASISTWAARHREMHRLLWKRCHSLDHKFIRCPDDYEWDDYMMVVLANEEQYKPISEESIQQCKLQGISFCYMLSDHEFYDLTEGKKKTVVYSEYPNYHDEIHAKWWII